MSEDGEKASIGSMLRTVREGKGLSLEAFGKATGVHWTHIGKIEKGSIKNPGINVVWKLCNGLGIKVDALFLAEELLDDDVHTSVVVGKGGKVVRMSTPWPLSSDLPPAIAPMRTVLQAPEEATLPVAPARPAWADELLAEMRALPQAIATALRSTGSLDEPGRDEKPQDVPRLPTKGRKRRHGPGLADASGASA